MPSQRGSAFFCGKNPSAAASRNEVQDQRDDREDNQQMNEEAANVHDEEAACPEDDEDQREKKEHGFTPLEVWDERRIARLQHMRGTEGEESCSLQEI
jgi:hypothetical protein